MGDFGSIFSIAVGLILAFACAFVFVREVKRRNYADKTYSELLRSYISSKKSPQRSKSSKGGGRRRPSNDETYGDIVLPEMGKMMSFSDMNKAMKLAFTPVKESQGDEEVNKEGEG